MLKELKTWGLSFPLFQGIKIPGNNIGRAYGTVRENSSNTKHPSSGGTADFITPEFIPGDWTQEQKNPKTPRKKNPV